MPSICFTLLLLLFVFTEGGAVRAQPLPPLSPVAAQEGGAGVRWGRYVLHPGVMASLGYDTNYFRRSGDSITLDGYETARESPIVSAWRLRITPALVLVNQASEAARSGVPPKLMFRATTYAAYDEVIAAAEYRGERTDQRRLDAGLEVLLDALPERVWGADARGQYVRISEPSGSEDVELGWEREAAGLDLGASWRPLGGMLRWRLGYGFRYTWFRENFQYLNNFEQAVETRGSFRFLPRTVFFYEGRYAFLRYQYLDTDQNHGDSIHTRLGINTLFSSRVAVVAAAGWTASFYQRVGNTEVHNWDGMTYTAEGRYFLNPTRPLQPGDTGQGMSSAAVGITRSYQNSYLADYARRTRGFARVNLLVGQRMRLESGVGVALLQRPEFEIRDEVVRPQDEYRIDATALAEYRLIQSVAVRGTATYDASPSDVYFFVPAAAGDATSRPFSDNLAYSRLQLWLGLRWFL